MGRPSFSSLCMVYPDVCGGVWSCHGSSLVPLPWPMSALLLVDDPRGLVARPGDGVATEDLHAGVDAEGSPDIRFGLLLRPVAGTGVLARQLDPDHQRGGAAIGLDHLVLQ